MKSMLKAAALLSSAALIGAGVYILSNDKARKQTAKKISSVMDDMEHMVNKKLNYNK